MTYTIVERVRERYTEHPDLAQLFDDSVVSFFDLTPPEVKVLAALLLSDGDDEQARPLTELAPRAFNLTVASLADKGLVAAVEGRLSLEPAQRRLRMEWADEVPWWKDHTAPPRKVVFRPIREQVAVLARSGQSPAAGLAAVYAWLYGRRLARKDFGVLGKLANQLGTVRAGLFLLEHCCDHFDGDPLQELIPLATFLGNGGRTEEDVAEDEEIRKGWQDADEASWRARMLRWHNEGGKLHALAGIDAAEDAGLIWPEQAEADRRQVELDYARWEAAGQPEVF